jgi:hypothetical protein
MLYNVAVMRKFTMINVLFWSMAFHILDEGLWLSLSAVINDVLETYKLIFYTEITLHINITLIRNHKKNENSDDYFHNSSVDIHWVLIIPEEHGFRLCIPCPPVSPAVNSISWWRKKSNQESKWRDTVLKWSLVLLTCRKRQLNEDIPSKETAKP